MKKKSLEKLHTIEVEILDEIVRICNTHNLRYYLIGGTLLGAIRHKGFIPWDDDLDIAMPREDYERFCKVAVLELSSNYYLHSKDTDDEYWLPFAKVKKKGTIFCDATAPWVKLNGIWVDIFPLDLDRLDNAKEIQNKFLKHARYRLMITDKLRNKRGWKWWIKYVLFGFPSIKTMNRRIYEITSGCKIINSDAYVNYGSQYGVKKQTMPIGWYDDSVNVEFEGKLYKAPKEYIKVLTKIYGSNFMQLPPLEKRITHNPIRLCFDINGVDELFDYI